MSAVKLGTDVSWEIPTKWEWLWLANYAALCFIIFFEERLCQQNQSWEQIKMHKLLSLFWLFQMIFSFWMFNWNTRNANNHHEICASEVEGKWKGKEGRWKCVSEWIFVTVAFSHAWIVSSENSTGEGCKCGSLVFYFCFCSFCHSPSSSFLLLHVSHVRYRAQLGGSPKEREFLRGFLTIFLVVFLPQLHGPLKILTFYRFQWLLRCKMRGQHCVVTCCTCSSFIYCSCRCHCITSSRCSFVDRTISLLVIFWDQGWSYYLYCSTIDSFTRNLSR